MKTWLGWISLTIVLAVVLHFVGLWLVPRLMTQISVGAIAKRTGTGWQPNKFLGGKLRYAGTDLIVQDNPDTLTSFAQYDVSTKPIRVHCVIPESDSYWSISLFAWNTDNFFVLNDKQAKAKEFDLVIVKENSKYQKQPSEELVIAPSDKGVILLRLIVTDRNNETEISQMGEVLKRSKIETIDSTEY